MSETPPYYAVVVGGSVEDNSPEVDVIDLDFMEDRFAYMDVYPADVETAIERLRSHGLDDYVSTVQEWLDDFREELKERGIDR